MYVGNVRVYQTLDEGTTWNQVFTPESAPYNYSNVGTKCLAIEVCDYDSSIIFAGYEIQGNDKGGVFYSQDRGATWDQLLLEASIVGQDVDVSDIVFNIEGTDTVAYLSALYDLSVPQGYSVYRAVKSGATWTIAQDMGPIGTSSGSVIVATLWDLVLSPARDTLYAVGTDAGTNHPTAYIKPLTSTGLWSNMGSSGFPMLPGTEATAVTIGLDTVYVAVDNEIYSFDLAGTSWIMAYAYPTGTRINVLFYDELLAGTDIGFFGHNSSIVVSNENDSEMTPQQFSLAQNYPNPFNPDTVISYELSVPGYTEMTIYNVLGQRITTLVHDCRTAGAYEVQWNGTNDQGLKVATGIYFYRLQLGEIRQTRKMLLIK